MLNLKNLLYSVTALFVFSEIGYSYNLKPRARENFEVIKLKTDGEEKLYRGLSNIINYWHEVPRDFAFGLAFGSIGSPYREENDSKPAEIFQGSFRTYTAGIEYKKWISKFPFVRAGIYNNYFQMASDDPVSGYSYYLGGGYEFDLSGVGLALEAGRKIGNYGGEWELESNMVAIGVHFYK